MTSRIKPMKHNTKKNQLPKFTIEDLVKAPEPDYANFESENRVFIMFNTISPHMTKLKEEDKFSYKGETYQIKMKMPMSSHQKNTQFNCLKASET